MSTQAPTEICPQCAEALTPDPRFQVWCPACEWNLCPAPKPPVGLTPKQQRRRLREEQRDARRREAVGARADKLYAGLVAGTPAHRDASWLAAMALAGLVHLASLAVLALSIAAVLTGPWPLRIVGLLGLAFAYLLRPRLGRLDRGAAGLPRAKAPELYALVDQVAAAVGGKPVDLIRVDSEFNASYAQVGLRRRSVLTIGLPLWGVLTAEQQVALLGHEIGHGVNGDPRRGLWLKSALAALTEWDELLLSILRSTRALGRSAKSAAAAALAVLVFGSARLVLLALLRLLDRLTDRSGQGAEYRADTLAARAGSTAAARGLLEVLMLEHSVETVTARHRNRPVRRRAGEPPATDELWAELGAHLASVPGLERERQLRLSAREFATVDGTHPPTHLRIRMLGERPVAEGAVVLGAEQAAAIEAELAPARVAAGRLLLGH